MAEKSINIASWPCLSNGLHYNWLVDYAAFSAFGTFELSAEEWEKRDLIVNFKGNSELTTEIDHQQAVDKAIDLVSSFLKAVFSEKREPQTHSLPFHNSLWSAYQPQPESILSADSASSANRYVRQQVCRMPTTHSASQLQKMRMEMKWIHFI